MKVLGVIPARYASNRLPRKVLRDLRGKSLIQRVYERVRQCTELHKIIIAVDHQEVADCVASFGAEWIMTSINHPSGTDRCAEILKHYAEYTHLINVQGDEPFIDPKCIEDLIQLLDDPKVKIASLMSPIQQISDLVNPNIVKVVINKHSEAMYFSRSPIPHQRGMEISNDLINEQSFRHIGIYGFEARTLFDITALPVGNLEKIEMLEQLRWLENGYRIHMGITHSLSIGIDTEEDLLIAIEKFK